MNKYTPDRWLIVKITHEQTIYKIFASWVGGYLHGDSWRLNSGIVSVKQDGDFLLFEGSSGSVYKCHKDTYGTTGYGAGVLNDLIEQTKSSNITIDILPRDTDVFAIDYS